MLFMLSPSYLRLITSSSNQATQISPWPPLFSSWWSSCGRKRPSCSPPPTALPVLAFLVMSLLLLVQLPPGEEGVTGTGGRGRRPRPTAAAMRPRRIPPRRRSPWNPFGFRLLLVVMSDSGCKKWWCIWLLSAV
ncbi:hypothetical protein GW17_00012417 [Ensete ventricosum]|nr:hypothetical protein GW17_00012417 [Ensete ventricosum]